MATQGSGSNAEYCEACGGPCKLNESQTDLQTTTRAQMNESQTDFKTIEWSSKNPRSSYELKRCFKEQTDTKVTVDRRNWKTEVPQLCKLLGLRSVATKDEVEGALDKAQAFRPSPSSLLSAAKYEYDTNKRVKYDAQVLENGECKLKIIIPAKYQPELSNPNSDESRELELYAKQELARAFGTPENLLLPEVSRFETTQGSLRLNVFLGVAVGTLILIGIGLTQTPEWNDHQFEILMAVGGAVGGTAIGAFGGFIGAGIGAIVGGAYGLGIAWVIKYGSLEQTSKCAVAFFQFAANGAIALTLKFLRPKITDIGKRFLSANETARKT